MEEENLYAVIFFIIFLVNIKLFKSLLNKIFPRFVLIKIKAAPANVITAITKNIINFPVIIPAENDINIVVLPDISPPSSLIIFSNIGKIFTTRRIITKDIIIKSISG